LNIAFSAVLIVLLVLPGVVFNKYHSVSGRFKSQHQIADEFFPSIGAAGIAHCVWILGCYMISGCTGLYVDIEAVLLLTAGQLGKQKDSVDAIEAVSNHPIAVSLYFSSILLVCCGLGRLHRWLRLKLHGQVHALMAYSAEDESQARRFAEWTETLPVDVPKSGITRIVIVASVVVGSKSYLYAGLLKKVFWDEATGEPEWFQLCSTVRRDILDDKLSDTSAETWYDVEGESFMIRFSTVDTLNLIYSAFEESNESMDPTPQKQLATTADTTGGDGIVELLPPYEEPSA
jgi:hypothetical protein